ncbi:hypothetical protein GI374_12605 [Paracoccus sp. S-4012]|uniref:holin family protein n=1 Tax=Paracoccus sp. S-4012 TaxID=2665648 RepID=UPI0012B132D9|nr:holin family protein [Paracoccus sp. S-4012]MRX51271.1 hypothetical protein [Paracoccus sp. S-4012]
MGMIDRLLGLGPTATAVGNAATSVAEVFRENATRRMELDEEAYARAMAEHGAEFQMPRAGWFDGFVNGLNRLPRPMLTVGTLSLFGYAMADPGGFSMRMEGLALVPEPLWWLMGAIVSFYFGAREAHYFRHRVWPQATVRQTSVTADEAGAVATSVEARLPAVPTGIFDDNPALAEWASERR